MFFSSNSNQYNGNISSVYWATNLNQVKSGFGYKYDELNRLTHGEYYRGTDYGCLHDGSFNEKNLTYDANGNLKTLNRYGTGNSPIDLLSYNYLNNGYQISYIVDPTMDVPGVVDYTGQTSGTQGFQCDRNGNMTIDRDKGINTPILYSYLNKPEQMEFGNGEKIMYLYDGAGTKLAKKTVKDNAIQGSSMIYMGNFVYDWNGTLQYILTSDGRLVPDSNTYRVEYFMKDHLGSTRAIYAHAAPGLAQVAEYQHYYPFGMQLEGLCYTSGADVDNNLFYNGKELQTDYKLQWYDYGARFYDPQLARWHSVDPLAEKSRRWSPYVYGLDNPIRFIDYNGMSPELFINGESAETAKNQLQQSTNLTLTRDNETGKISATGEAKSQNDKKLLEVINSTDVAVNVTANPTNEISTGIYSKVGGAFMGNEISSATMTLVAGTKPYNPIEMEITTVKTQQVVNPTVLDQIDTYYNEPGASILHEVTESFEGGKISKRAGVSSPNSGEVGTVYKKAHDAATPQPPVYGRYVGLNIEYFMKQEGKSEEVLKNK